MSSPIASLFAELGFRVNDKGLKGFEKQLNDVANTIQGTSAATVKANKAADKSTEKSVDKHIELIKRIKANYAKVQPSLQRASHELKEIQAALTEPGAKGAKREKLLEAQDRVEKRINHLIGQEKKAQESIAKHEKAIREKQAREKDAEDKKWRNIKEKRDLEKWKIEGQKLREEQAAKEKAQRKADQIQRQRETRERRARSEARQAEKHKYDLQKKAADLESKRNNEKRRAQLHELRMQQRINNAHRRGRRSSRGYYRGAREYGRAFIPGIGGAFAAMQSTQAYQDYQGMQSSLTMATGSPEQAQQEISFLSDLANRLGMFVGEMGKNYASLSANTKNTSLEGEGTRQVFEAVSSYARVLNLSKEDQSGVFRALSQMVGKGQIYAEELRQQMGERAPGALQAMARAAGYGDSEEGIAQFYEAVEAGQIRATEVFPKFSEELMKMANSGNALDKAMNNTAASIGRFKTNVWLANKTFNEAGYDRAVRNFFNTSSDAIMEAEPLWILMGKTATYLGKAIEAPIELFGELASRLGEFTEEGFKASREFKQMMAAAILFIKPLRKLFAIFYLLPASIAAVTDTLDEGFDSWDDFFDKMALWSTTAAALLVSLKGIRNVLGVAMLRSVLTKIPAVGIDSEQSEDSILKRMNESRETRNRLFPEQMQEDNWFTELRDWMSGGIDSIMPDFDYTIMSDSFAKSYGISKADAGTQYVGDVYITVESPDPNLAGLKIEETYRNIFNMELRTASVNQQVTEK